MAHKQVLFRSAAREKILRGATQLADAVRVTLGPRSKSVLIEKKWGTPLVCNDGVTIAKEFDLKDPEENLGARMLRQAAEKTGDMVGDGTSMATLLAHAIFADGIRNVVAGAPPEVEMKSKKEALDDAISAAKAAVAEGIVPGGGLALLRCVDAVANEEGKCDGDERTGVQILKRALEAPTRQIAENSATDGGVAEEAPGAYKDIDAVVEAAHRAGLARKVARLEPVICIKG
jgi:chaperonin GroEL (HSP60 family)